MKQLKQVAAASQKSEDGSLDAVFEVSLRYVVTVGFDGDEIGDLNEERLRESLSQEVDEMVSMTNTQESINIGPIIELRNGGISGEIIEGVLDSEMQTYAVIGRVPGDDEDSCYIVQASSREDAMSMFADRIYEDSDLTEEDREHNIDVHGGDLGVFINHVLVSGSEIKEAE